LKPTQEIVRPYLKIPNTKRAGGVAQSVQKHIKEDAIFFNEPVVSRSL
jgi:hypothetical protein